MDDGRPLGSPRLISAIEARSDRPLRGAALFFTAGAVQAMVRADNPMTSAKRQIEEVSARAVRNRLPFVVGLAVGFDGIDVYPTTLRGEVSGDPLFRLQVGEFSATTYRRLLVVGLVLVRADQRRIDLETKAFPVGVNRHNASVAHMIVKMVAGQVE